MYHYAANIMTPDGLATLGVVGLFVIATYERFVILRPLCHTANESPSTEEVSVETY